MKLRISVHNELYGFWVDIFDGPTKIAQLGWHGGDFEYNGQTYIVRGPYHGLEYYVIYKIVEVYNEALQKSSRGGLFL